MSVLGRRKSWVLPFQKEDGTSEKVDLKDYDLIEDGAFRMCFLLGQKMHQYEIYIGDVEEKYTLIRGYETLFTGARFIDVIPVMVEDARECSD